MDKIEKTLNKLSEDEKVRLKEVLLKVKKGKLEGLDIKKLKAKENIFRVRKGKLRIIFCKNDKAIKILALERRGDTTYK